MYIFVINMLLLLLCCCSCVKVLQLKTFRVVTGHTLSSLGTAAQSEAILTALFPQLDPAATADTAAVTVGEGRVPVPPSTKAPHRTGPPVVRAPLPPALAGKTSGRYPGQTTGHPGSAKEPHAIPSTGAHQPGQQGSTRGAAVSLVSGQSRPGSVAVPKDRIASLDAATKAGGLVQQRARPHEGENRQNKKKKLTKPLNFFVAVNTDGMYYTLLLCMYYTILCTLKYL